jgi:hypothetical protein
MIVNAEVEINSTKEKIWSVITDIENSPDVISGIKKVEILAEPEDELVGLKWRETRTIFGKTATEDMWITEAAENKYYKVCAESHGSRYKTNFYISENNGSCILKTEFISEPISLFSLLLSNAIGFLFKKSTEKALKQDLIDIKKFLEKK